MIGVEKAAGFAYLTKVDCHPLRTPAVSIHHHQRFAAPVIGTLRGLFTRAASSQGPASSAVHRDLRAGWCLFGLSQNDISPRWIQVNLHSRVAPSWRTIKAAIFHRNLYWVFPCLLSYCRWWNFLRHLQALIWINNMINGILMLDLFSLVNMCNGVPCLIMYRKTTISSLCTNMCITTWHQVIRNSKKRL